MDEERVNLRQYQRFERKFPWSLILKIIIAGLLIAAILYMTKMLETTETAPENGIEVEVELPD